jgi:hypothetical protein
MQPSSPRRAYRRRTDAMIRPLRQRHRRIVSVLGVCLPVAFAVGIAARKPAPTMAVLPPLGGEAGPHFTKVMWAKDDLWPGQTIRTRLVADATGHFAVELTPGKNFIRPDLLVYWTPNHAKAGDKLPDNATLLGAFTAERQLPLSRELTSPGGALVLYSLADHEVVAVSKSITP